MMAAVVFLSGFRVSILTLLIVSTCGFPQKSSQGSSSGANAAVNYASYQGGAPTIGAAPYAAVQDAYEPTFAQGPSTTLPVVSPVFSYGSAAPVGVQGAGPVAQAGVQDAGMSSVAEAGMQGAGVGQASGLTLVQSLAPVFTPPQVFVPQYSGGAQDGQSGKDAVLGSVGDLNIGHLMPSGFQLLNSTCVNNLTFSPDTQWSIPAPVFEAGSADTPSIVAVLPPPPLPPQEPTLKSGELSRVEKEAELGNYQQQTEEFGYPAGSGSGFGQGLGTVVVPGVQLGGAGPGGFRPVSPGNLDWMFLYGMIPQGTYSTFSQHHEAGKDYSQAIHYLKEHITDSDGSGQQKKFFPGHN